MSKPQYDFSRCTPEQLQAYAAATHDYIGSSTIAYREWMTVLEAALLPPPERKSDVARELAERLTQCLGPMTAELQREYADRYRKAVDS